MDPARREDSSTSQAMQAMSAVSINHDRGNFETTIETGDHFAKFFASAPILSVATTLLWRSEKPIGLFLVATRELRS